MSKDNDWVSVVGSRRPQKKEQLKEWHVVNDTKKITDKRDASRSNSDWEIITKKQVRKLSKNGSIQGNILPMNPVSWQDNMTARLQGIRTAYLVGRDRKEMQRKGLTAREFLRQKYGKDGVPSLAG